MDHVFVDGDGVRLMRFPLLVLTGHIALHEKEEYGGNDDEREEHHDGDAERFGELYGVVGQ